MTIQELISEYEAVSGKENAGELLKEKINIKSYQNYYVKVYFANTIIKSSYFNENGDVFIDSCKKYVTTCFTLLSMYTDIEMDTESLFDDFDNMEKAGLWEYIFKLFPESEIQAFEKILDMKEKDFMKNYYESQAFLQKRFDAMAGAVDGVLKLLTEKIKLLDPKDIEEMTGGLDKIM